MRKGKKWIKQEFIPFVTFSVNLPVDLPWSCHHNFCIYLTPDQGTWKARGSPSIPSPGFLLVSLQSHILFNNLKPHQGVQYSVLWGMNKHVVRSFYLFMTGHVLFCRTFFFFSSSLRTEKSYYSSTISELI